MLCKKLAEASIVGIGIMQDRRDIKTETRLNESGNGLFFEIRQLGKKQRAIVGAAFLGWSLDAFDFFLLVFVLKDVARTYHVTLTEVTLALFLTLAARPVGALIFGRLADRVGRKPVLMAVVALYPFFAFLSALAPSIGTFLLLRTLFGVAMGGEWGAGASLVMESIPPGCRGVVSGILQAGYPFGYLLAALAYAWIYPLAGWRGLLMLGILPAFIVFLVRRQVPESAAFSDKRESVAPSKEGILRQSWRTGLFAILLMTAFNFLGHGTQDLYPTLLETMRGLTPREVGGIAVFYNIGAVLGGIFLGAVSERIGRRRAILYAAIAAMAVLPFWGFAGSIGSIAVGAFLMQCAVQGAWGVIPAYLNEISPPALRGTFPGVVYQTGNLLAAANAPLQSHVARNLGGRLDLALVGVAGVAALSIALLIGRGPERRGEILHCHDLQT